MLCGRDRVTAIQDVTAGFTGVLDYIWCSANHIRPLAVVPVPDKANLEKVGGALPNVR